MATSEEASTETPERRLGVRLRREREARGWSQQEVATRLADRGISLHMSAIAKIEAGSRAVRLNEAMALARLLDVNVEELAKPPVSEINEIIGLLEKALSLHRDGEQVARLALDRLRDLDRDFDTESGPLKHPAFSTTIVGLLARLNEFGPQDRQASEANES